MLAFILTIGLAVSQPQQAPPVLPPQAPPVIVTESAYDAACRKSVRLRQKLAVHVGCKRADVGGLINVRVKWLPGFTEPCVIICRPDGRGWVEWERVVAPTASDREALGMASPARFLDPRSVPRQVSDCPT